MTLLEAYLGEQLLELLLSLASYTENSQFDGFLQAGSHGFKAGLEQFIPATLINKVLKKYILELLELKYLKHYGVLRLADRKVDDPVTYEVNPEKLFLLTELRLSYNTIWVSINLLIDIIVFFCSGSLAAALASGAFIEFLRRFKF